MTLTKLSTILKFGVTFVSLLTVGCSESDESPPASREEEADGCHQLLLWYHFEELVYFYKLKKKLRNLIDQVSLDKELSFMKLNNPDQAIKYNLTLSELLLLLTINLFDKKICCLHMVHYKHLQSCHLVICRNKNWDHSGFARRRRLQIRAVECKRKACISSGCILDMSSHQSQHS
jgi:hypothetical protein